MTLRHTGRIRPKNNQRRRVLLVEADRDLAAVFRAVLIGNGEEVELVDSAHAAIAALARDEHDVVVADLDDLDHPFAVLRVRGRRPIVVLAGAARGYGARAKSAGVRWVLEKPLKVETLLTAIATAAPLL